MQGDVIPIAKDYEVKQEREIDAAGTGMAIDMKNKR
jgi:hypothetical protein